MGTDSRLGPNLYSTNRLIDLCSICKTDLCYAEVRNVHETVATTASAQPNALCLAAVLLTAASKCCLIGPDRHADHVARLAVSCTRVVCSQLSDF